MKKNPGRVNYGSAGAGSVTHLTMELFKQQMGAFMLHIPYRGIAPAFNDLLGGQTQAMFGGGAGGALPHLRSGRVRTLAVTGRARGDQLKEAPTLGSPASRASTRCSGTARSARRGSRARSSSASTTRRSRP